MKPTQVAEALRLIRPTRRPVMLWGDPGTAKSSVVKQDIVDVHKRKMLDWRLALKDAVDLVGIPHVEKLGSELTTSWAPPSELPREPGTDIFMDEFVQASPAVMNAARQLIAGAPLSHVLPLIGAEALVGAVYVAVGLSTISLFELEARRGATLEVA